MAEVRGPVSLLHTITSPREAPLPCRPVPTSPGGHGGPPPPRAGKSRSSRHGVQSRSGSAHGVTSSQVIAIILRTRRTRTSLRRVDTARAGAEAGWAPRLRAGGIRIHTRG